MWQFRNKYVAYLISLIIITGNYVTLRDITKHWFHIKIWTFKPIQTLSSRSSITNDVICFSPNPQIDLSSRTSRTSQFLQTNKQPRLLQTCLESNNCNPRSKWPLYQLSITACPDLMIPASRRTIPKCQCLFVAAVATTKGQRHLRCRLGLPTNQQFHDRQSKSICP